MSAQTHLTYHTVCARGSCFTRRLRLIDLPHARTSYQKSTDYVDSADQRISERDGLGWMRHINMNTQINCHPRMHINSVWPVLNYNRKPPADVCICEGSFVVFRFLSFWVFSHSHTHTHVGSWKLASLRAARPTLCEGLLTLYIYIKYNKPLECKSDYIRS